MIFSLIKSNQRSEDSYICLGDSFFFQEKVLKCSPVLKFVQSCFFSTNLRSGLCI